MSKEENVQFVSENLTVRIDPYIYAFSTDTIPNYLKVGDTSKGVDNRIKQWEKILRKRLRPVLVKLTEKYRHSAYIPEKELYFRDYDVHKYFRNVLHKDSIDITDPELLAFYSNEFFKDVTVDDVEKAITEIYNEALSDSPIKTYKFYEKATAKSPTYHWNNDAEWSLRPNQKIVVDNFLMKKNKKELLMYAVMRFGKSFTAMQCALQGDKSKVLIVCAKADVLTEWKQTVEKPKCFKDYAFICDSDFKAGKTIDEILKERSKTKFAIFLTLQNLSGKASDGSNIKERLKKVFAEKYDLLIIDETHYGAWAKTYGDPISEDEDSKSIDDNESEHEDLLKKSKKIKATQKLHLSGTPYNLLYDDKFSDDNIIATCQFKDILEEKEKWDEEHLEDIENGAINKETNLPYQEWDNPYYGFPKMLRFAFNLPEKWLSKLRRYTKNGIKWSLSDLFKTKKVDGNLAFENEQDVIDLLKAIDGTNEEDGILGFLDIPKIKDNKVCKHIVMVLPYRSSCDAMEALLLAHKDDFKNLSLYEGIINIAGRNAPRTYSKIDNVKKDIEKYETDSKQTISLTVHRMLTGVTVKEWDTMLMLKSTKSAQEYDQASFRIQNQYVVEYVDGNGALFKKDMKPQTILVDFDPSRLFEVQGLSSRIVDKVKNNEESLDDSIARDLKYFPIITFNGDKLVKVEANNLVEIIMQYDKDKSIIDVANTVEMDEKILEDEYLLKFIKSQYKAGLTNKLTAKAHKGSKESEFSEPEEDEGKETENGNGGSEGGGETENNTELLQKYRMCIACLLFYSFLSNSNIDKVEDIIKSIKEPSSEQARNLRIFKNLRLDEKFIKAHIKNTTRMGSFNIDGAVKKANLLSKDKKLTKEQRANNALNRFSKMSDSEIVTPIDFCKKSLQAIGIDKLIEIINSGGTILDIASKTGEFTYALYDLLHDKVDEEKLLNCVYSIPTSSVTYEFTRKIYEVLGFNVECLAETVTSFDVISEFKDSVTYKKFVKKAFKKSFNELTKGDKNMKFDVVIGNPPYQATVREASEGNNKNTVDIYQDFQELALKISDASCLIYPAKEFQRGKTNTLDKTLVSLRIFNGSNREGEKHIPGEDSVFGDAVRRIPGDVGLVYYNKKKPTDKIIYQDIEIERTNKILPVIKEFLGLASKLESYAGLFKFSKIKKVCESNFVEHNKTEVLDKEVDRTKPAPKDYSKVLTNDKAGSGGKSKWYYIKTSKLDRGPFANYKVIIPSARPNESLADSSNIEILAIDENFGRAKMCIYDSTEFKKAEHCKKYLSTKFVKAVNAMTPDEFLYYLPDFESIYAKVDWEKNVDEIDEQLFGLFGISKKDIEYICDMFK